MRNPAGEEAELLERLRLATFGFVALALGDVAENENNAGDFVLAVANGRRDLFDDALIAVA